MVSNRELRTMERELLRILNPERANGDFRVCGVEFWRFYDPFVDFLEIKFEAESDVKNRAQLITLFKNLQVK